MLFAGIPAANTGCQNHRGKRLKPEFQSPVEKNDGT
jgi:hypothetical protein